MSAQQMLRRFLQGQPLRQAAVLVLNYQEQGKDYLVLTRRTEEVEHHKGQISFPGGTADPQDGSLWQTALRETQEELGLDPQTIQRQRELTPRLTPTGYEVTPFVATIPVPQRWHYNHIEIAEVFTVPFAYLQDPDHLVWRPRAIGSLEYLDPLFTYRHYEIWGLTARILCEFFGHPFPPEAQ